MISFRRVRAIDFKVLERADLDLADRGLVLVQGVNQDTDAATSNGAGKTTVFSAISWCLFGEVVGSGRLAEEVIRLGAERALVSVTFADDRHEYVVTRKRTPKTSSLELTTDGAQTNGRTQGDTEARIREILGLDWQAFRNTVLHGQGDHERFADRSVGDTERKAILKRILRLERFDVALEQVRTARKELTREGAAAKLEAARLEGARSQATSTLARLERLSSEWRERQARRIRDLEAELAATAEVDPRDRKLVAQLPRLRELEAGLKDAVARGSEVLRARATADVEVSRRDSARTTAGLNRNRLTAELERAIAELEKTRKTVAARECPTCGHTLEEDNRRIAQHVAERTRKVEALELDLQRAEGALQAAVEAHTAAEEERRGAEAAAVEARAWSEKAEKIRLLLADAKTAEVRLRMIDERRAVQTRELAAARVETDPNAVEVARASARAGEIVDEERKNEETIASLDRRDAPLKFWETAFSNRGLPSLALDLVAPMISAAANRYLQVLADGDLAVEVSTTTDLKGGTTREAIDLRFVVEGAPGVEPSGGQWRKFGLAVDLALMDLVAAREGAQIDLLLLDEVLDGLDVEGRARVVALLRVLRETRSSVFVVSHDEGVSEAFETVVTVTKRGGSATVEGGA